MWPRSLLIIGMISVGGLVQAQLQCLQLLGRITALSQYESIVVARFSAPQLENRNAFRKFSISELKKLQYRRFLVNASEFAAALAHFSLPASSILIEREGVKYLQIEIRDAIGV